MDCGTKIKAHTKHMDTMDTYKYTLKFSRVGVLKLCSIQLGELSVMIEHGTNTLNYQNNLPYEKKHT